MASSPSAKRRRVEAAAGPPPPPPAAAAAESDGDADGDDAPPSDALAALHLLLAQAAAPPPPGAPPFALVSQLYTVLADRTDADRDLDALAAAGAVRIVRLPSGPDDRAVCRRGDYAAAVASCGARAAAAAPAGAPGAPARAAAAVFAWFAAAVLPACPGESVAYGELVRLLRRGGGAGAARAGDAHVALLLREGCLVRATRPGAGAGAGGGAGGGGDLYDFALPCVGPAARAVRAGREELLGLLRRRRGGEAPEAALARVRLRASPLGVRWHVRDLLGSGALARALTPAGPMLRVVRRG